MKKEKDDVVHEAHGLMKYVQAQVKLVLGQVETSRSEKGKTSAKIKGEKTKKAKGAGKTDTIDSSTHSGKFEGMDKKTVEIAETIIAQFTLLYTENTSLALEVQQMTKTIQEEQQIKEEINSEFERIKGKLELVKQWETEVTILRKKNDWLCAHIQKVT